MGELDKEIELAILDPTSVFATPDEVLRRKDIPKKDKILILKSWEYDVRDLEVAREEGMPGVAMRVKLVDVLDALHTLGGVSEQTHTGKQ